MDLGGIPQCRDQLGAGVADNVDLPALLRSMEGIFCEDFELKYYFVIV